MYIILFLGFSPLVSYIFIGLMIAVPLFFYIWFTFIHVPARPEHVASKKQEEETLLQEDITLLSHQEILEKLQVALANDKFLEAEEYLYYIIKHGSDMQLIQEALQKLIEITFKLAQHPKALEYGLRYRSMYGELSEIEVIIGHCQVALNNESDAQQIFEKILAHDAHNIQALHGLAIIFRKQGNHERAREIQQEIFTINEQNKLAL